MSEPEERIVTMKHVRMAGICSAGARAWFKRHELSWASFVENGMTVRDLEAVGDGMGRRVTKHAREEANDGG